MGENNSSALPGALEHDKIMPTRTDAQPLPQPPVKDEPQGAPGTKVESQKLQSGTVTNAPA